MELIQGLTYGLLFASIAYFVLTINSIANASSKPTRSTIKASFVLLVIFPIVAGIFYSFAGDDAIYFKLGSIFSSAAGMYFITRGIKEAVIEAYARDAEAELAAEEEIEKQLLEDDEELDTEQDWIKNGEWKTDDSTNK